ncbi:hypothetical protein BVG19_g1547 [[Candida] boidinii]|nr:hypothetical protein BVG19_g1547 [[Candida] boidinii]OWB50295.1 hypothetical protein B5S27_g1843 [[Candida] boidinii]
MGPYRTDVIIIGAGIAGTKAAIELSKAGISNIILEARDRVGGRLNTVNLNDTNDAQSSQKIDLGASWFHDCINNPLFDKYRNHKDVDFVFDDSSIGYYNKEEGFIDITNTELLEIFQEMSDFIEINYSDLKIENDISLKEAAYQYLLRQKDVLTDFQIKNAPQILKIFESWIGSSWDTLSARLITGDRRYGRNAFCLTGWSTIYNYELQELSNILGYKELDLNELDTNNNLKLNCLVSEIRSNEKTNEITVNTRDIKNNVTREYISKYVICTVPLSILKLKNNEYGSIKWFPQLTPSLNYALDHMSFCSLGKIFIEFSEEDFKKLNWKHEYYQSYFIPDKDEELLKRFENNELNSYSNSNKEFHKFKRTETEITSPPDPTGFSHLMLLINLHKYTNKPILGFLTPNPLTEYLEKDPENRIWPVIKPLLQKIIQSDNESCEIADIPKPKKIINSNWTTDPLSRGSYTGATVYDDLDIAIESLINSDVYNGRVRFAGEHTHAKANGCIHGAWISGAREAHKIMNMMNKPKL